MSPPKPPQPRPPSNRSPAVREELAPGAVHPLRPAAPPFDQRDTKPPPYAPDLRPPPRGMRGSSAGIVVPRLGYPVAPAKFAEPEEPTLLGLAPPPPRPELDSVEIATGALLTELAARAHAEREARAENDALRVQLRELDRSNRLPRVEVAPSSRPPKKAEWIKLFFGFVGAVTLFLGAAGTYLGARAASNEIKVDNVAATAKAQKVITDPLPAQVAHVERGADSCKEWARLYADYDRQVFRKLGVLIPEPENAKPVDPIKTRAPVRRPNSITADPVLEIMTMPPTLP